MIEPFKTRILELADRIEKHREYKLPGLDMTKWFGVGGDDYGLGGIPEYIEDEKHWCGTTACIAGHITLMRLQKEGVKETNHYFEYEARMWLGLNEDQAQNLFHWSVQADEQGAAKVLRHLAETDEVDWYIAC